MGKTEVLRACNESLQTAQEEAKAAKEALAAARRHVQDFVPEQQEIARAQSLENARLQDFLDGPRAAFASLESKLANPPAEVATNPNDDEPDSEMPASLPA